MSSPVKIFDLARRMVELSGLTVRGEQFLSWPQIQDKLNALSMSLGIKEMSMIRAGAANRKRLPTQLRSGGLGAFGQPARGGR
jgi:hypothetical protein